MTGLIPALPATDENQDAEAKPNPVQAACHGNRARQQILASATAIPGRQQVLPSGNQSTGPLKTAHPERMTTYSMNRTSNLYFSEINHVNAGKQAAFQVEVPQ